MLAPAAPESRLLYNYPSVPGGKLERVKKFAENSGSLDRYGKIWIEKIGVKNCRKIQREVNRRRGKL